MTEPSLLVAASELPLIGAVLYAAIGAGRRSFGFPVLLCYVSALAGLGIAAGLGIVRYSGLGTQTVEAAHRFASTISAGTLFSLAGLALILANRDRPRWSVAIVIVAMLLGAAGTVLGLRDVSFPVASLLAFSIGLHSLLGVSCRGALLLFLATLAVIAMPLLGFLSPDLRIAMFHVALAGWVAALSYVLPSLGRARLSV
ncbi:hypothetical protein WAB17_07680 [Parerythrobacter aurantius]|uniref:hypothetical protein n=1 Tax=Parerythrobacter aurantius TaxID=3127706 RepID=UPI0032446F7F